jgi:hypothetical protein
VVSHSHTADTRARISHGLKRYYERKRKLAIVTPRDLRLERRGLVAASLRPALLAAEAECADVLGALGGADHVSPQRRVIVEDLARVGVALRGTLAAYLRTEDPELASKVGSLASVRRASLSALGLDRVTRELDLSEYLKQTAENRAGATNGDDPDPSAVDASVCAPTGDEGGACPELTPSAGGRRPHPPPQDSKGDRNATDHPNP